ncbi:MAG: hypothetical protein WBK51_02700 [Polaromonas sp.]
MTSITIELPDDIASQAEQAGMLSSSAIAKLVEQAVARVNQDDAWFRQEVGASLEQADRADATWLSHAQVQAEWQAERADLLAHKSL